MKQLVHVGIAPLMVCLIATVTACSSGNGTTPITTNGASSESTTASGSQSVTPSWNTYQDSSIQLRYPPTWILDDSVIGVNARFIDSRTNAFGENDSCHYFQEVQIDSSILEEVDLALTFIFAQSPEPQIQYLEIEGNPSARITGIEASTISGFPIEGARGSTARTQLIYSNDVITYGLTCTGFTDEAELIDAIFNSVTLFNEPRNAR